MRTHLLPAGVDVALVLSDRFSKVATPDLGIARLAIEQPHGPFDARRTAPRVSLAFRTFDDMSPA